MVLETAHSLKKRGRCGRTFMSVLIHRAWSSWAFVVTVRITTARERNTSHKPRDLSRSSSEFHSTVRSSEP